MRSGCVRAAALALLTSQAKAVTRAEARGQVLAAADAVTGQADAMAAWTLANGWPPDEVCPLTGRPLLPQPPHGSQIWHEYG